MKKAIAAGVIVVVVLASLWCFGRPAYGRYQEKRYAQQARECMAKRDYRHAALSAQQALRHNPRNVDACRVNAELADLSRSPNALDWRRRVAEAEPTIQNKLLLATTALRAQGPPYPLATQTLEELTDSAKGVATYHAVWAELALKLKNSGEAAARFEQASRLEPTNGLYQLNLAVLRLQSTNAATAAAARATLERLRRDPRLGAVALRWLVAECLRQKDPAGAQGFSTQLLADAHCVPEDRLQHLTILQQAHSAEFTQYLETVRRLEVTNALEVYGLSSWMLSHGLVDEALGWLTNCPAKVRSEQPVPLALVDCYLVKKNWEALETFLQQEKWADRECLRWAFLSRTAAELNQNQAAEVRWRTAVREAGGRLGPLTALLGLATSWGRNTDKEDLLWQIAQRFPKERWAIRELDRLYLAAGNTRGLNKLYAMMASYDARNFVAQNNLAATSLLLNLNLPKTHELAKEVFTQHPGEAVIASTYAYSLHLQGRTRDGLAVLEKLKADALETPPVALYYGILLSAAGDTNKAGKYLSIAQKSDLLPEEKALATEATKRLPSAN
jgi:Tfp pilus assembly protein PilF